MVVWFNFLEDFVYKKFGKKDGKCIYLSALEPFWFNDPWSKELEGKKVLVVHPFAETIKKQYSQNRGVLYKNTNILPAFDLITIQAVQSIGGAKTGFETWFEALDYMYDEVAKCDFDIAIIGCGAYGFPLASKIKDLGKKAIHMGGVTQFYFGICGTRWDKRPKYAALYNEYWCRPSINEIPQNSKEIENGCYW